MPGQAIGTRIFVAAALAVLLSVFVTLAPASAVAKPAWLAPVVLSAAGVTTGDGSSQVAVDPQGEAVDVWTHTKGSETVDIEASSRPPGGAWQAPVRLSPPAGREPPWAHEGEAQDPHVAIDAKGDAVAVWKYYDGSVWLTVSATRPAGGTWQPMTIVSPGSAEARQVGIAVDAQGDAVAIWTNKIAAHADAGIVEASTRPAGGVWSPAVQLSAAGDKVESPSVKVDAQGEAVAVWEGGEGGGGPVEASTRPASGTWQAPVTISAKGTLYNTVAVDPQGEAVAVWLREGIIEASTRPAGGTWQAPVHLSPAGRTAWVPQIAIDAQGEGVAVWGSWTGEPYKETSKAVESAIRPAGGAWQAPVQLSTTNPRVESLAVDALGDAVAVWNCCGTIEGAVRPAGGTWQATTDIAASADGEPHVAIDGQGDAVAAWAGHEAAAEAAGYDAAGPLLNGLQIPATGIARQPVSFSVSPLDVWSSLGTTSWSFGDGTSTSGTSVTHTYTATGSYHVTLTSADVLGNTSSTSATITITRGGPAPTLTRVSLTNKRFRVGKQATAISAKKTPLGTAFRFTLSAAAKLQITITRTASGLRHGHSCLAPSAKLKRAHAKRCTRTLTAGTLTRGSEAKGADKIAFSGRFGSRALSPRSYNAVLTASNTNGSSKPVTLSFTVGH